MEEKKKYVVAPGCSFVGNKKIYNAGDEIDESAFKDEERFKKFLTGSKPKIIPAPPKVSAEEEKDEEVITTLSREELEALAADFMTVDAIQKLDDAKLKKILKKKGKIS